MKTILYAVFVAICCCGCQSGTYATKVVPALDNFGALGAPNDVWELVLKLDDLRNKHADRQFQQGDTEAMRKALESGTNFWVRTKDLSKIQGYLLSETQPLENDRLWLVIQHPQPAENGNPLPKVEEVPESLLRLRLLMEPQKK